MSNGTRHLYEFGPFQLSEHEGVLRRDGHAISLTPKAFDLLIALLKGAGRVLTKDELLQTVWAGAQMDESNLPTQIAILRKVIGDECVKTVPRRGYRFAVEATERWEEHSSPVPQADTAPANSNASERAPGTAGSAIRSSWSFRRSYVGVLLVAVGVVGAVIVLALRTGGHAAKPVSSTLMTGRLLAQATSEAGSAIRIKLDRVPDEILVTPDGTKLYLIEQLAKTITVMNASSLKVTGVVELPSAARCAAMTRDGKRIYVGSLVEGVMVLDVEHDRILERVFPTDGPVYGLAVTPDEKKLFLAMGSAGLKRIFTSNGETEQLSRITCPMHLRIDPNGSELYVSYQCGGPGGRRGHDAVEIYDVNTERTLATVSGPPMVGNDPSFAPNSPFVLLSGGDACLTASYDHMGCPSVPGNVYHLLRSADRRFVKTFAMPGSETPGVFLPDGKRVIFWGDSLSIIDPLNETVLERFMRSGELYGRAAFTPAGNRAIIPVVPSGLLVVDTLDPGCLPTTRGLFNQYSGDGTLDDAQQSQSLTAEGGPEFVPGLVGQAFHFNGKDSLLRAGLWGACAGCGDSWSESLYVKFNALDGNMTILEHGRYPKGSQHRLLKSVDNRIVLEAGDRSKPEASISTAVPISAGVWYHLASVKDKGERILYVNGTAAGQIRLPPVDPYSSNSEVVGAYVGASRDKTSFLNGLVDELAFYNRALSAAEIKGMYELTLHRPCSPGRAR